MKKKIFTILFCCGVLAIAVILLLVFLPQKDKNSFMGLKCYVEENISLNVNTKIENYYTLNDTTATLAFDVDKEGVIEINEDYIKGISAGVVKVVMTASTSTDTVKVDFTVTVYQNAYSLRINPIDACSFENNTFYITNNVFQFSAEIFDKSNNKVDALIEIQSDNEEIIINSHNLLNIMIVTEKECVLTFKIENLSLNYTFDVVYKK